MSNEKVYYKLSEYLVNRFGGKVWKVPVDAGFTCPNRDGLKGDSGCSYCSVESFDGSEQGDISEQVYKRVEKLKKREISRYIVYFQSYSNTYADTDTVRKRVESSLVDDGIVAVHIGTRPDVIDEEKLEYFRSLNEKYEVVIEYGLQSANDETLRNICRGHTVHDFVDAVEVTHKYGIKTCAHIIFGLPGDTREDMMSSVELVNRLNMHSVKFHHLHIVKGTKMADDFREGKFSAMTEDEYIDILSEGLGRLDPDVVVSRIVGDAAGDTLIAPDWPKNKGAFEQRLKKHMQSKGICQGSLRKL